MVGRWNFCLGPDLFSGALLLVSRSVNANQQIYNGFVPACASINAPWSHEPNVLWHSNVPTLSSMSGHWFAERLDVGQNTFANPRNELPNLWPKSHGKKIRIPNSKKSLISKPPRNLSKKNPKNNFITSRNLQKNFELPTHIKQPNQQIQPVSGSSAAMPRSASCCINLSPWEQVNRSPNQGLTRNTRVHPSVHEWSNG